MSVSILLLELSKKLICNQNNKNDQESHKRRQFAFVQNVLNRNQNTLTENIDKKSYDDILLDLAGLSFVWSQQQRNDHALALQLLIDKLRQCIVLPKLNETLYNQCYATNDQQTEKCFDENLSMLRFLFSLYKLSSSENHHLLPMNKHLLTVYSEKLVRKYRTNEQEGTEISGWKIVSEPTKSLSTGDSNDHIGLTNLTIHDTTFDTVWNELLRENVISEAQQTPKLFHPIFSNSNYFLESYSPLQDDDPTIPRNKDVDNSSLNHIYLDQKVKHSFEANSTLFGALSFAHTSIIPKSLFDEIKNPSKIPKLRTDILYDDLNINFDLPDLEQGQKTAWIEIQQFKPNLFEASSTSLNNTKTLSITEKPNKNIKHELLKKKESKKDEIMRLLHGDLIVTPSSSSSFKHRGLPIEIPPRNWKDQLIARAHHIQQIWISIDQIIRGHLSHVNSFYPDSKLVSIAFCKGLNDFLHFLRGKLLFCEKSIRQPKRACSEHPLQSIQPKIHIHGHGVSLLDDIYSKMQPDSIEEHLKPFFKFSTIQTQLEFVKHFLCNLCDHYDSQTHYTKDEYHALGAKIPIGSKLLTKLFDACFTCQTDPHITSGIVSKLLTIAFHPYAGFLKQWAFDGHLPAQNDFFIQHQKNDLNRNSSHQNTLNTSIDIAYDSLDPSFVHQTDFQMIEEKFPTFLLEVKNIIYDSGILINIYKGATSLLNHNLNHGSNRPSPKIPHLNFVWDFSSFFSSHNRWKNYFSSYNNLSSEGKSYYDDFEVSQLHLEDKSKFSVQNALKFGIFEPLEAQYRLISAKTCQLFVKDLSLIDNIRKLKRDMFGTLVEAAFDCLPLGVDLIDPSASSQSLDRLRLLFAENIAPFLHKEGYDLFVDRLAKSRGFDVVDNIEIQPTFLKWPLSLIITPDHIKKYNDIFKLLLKIKRSIACLNTLWLNLSSSTKQAHKEKLAQRRSKSTRKTAVNNHDGSIWENNVDYDKVIRSLHKASLFCHQLSHFANHMYNFIYNQIFHTCFYSLEKDVENSKHFEDLLKSHENFINNAFKSSMLNEGSRSVMIVIEKVIHIIHRFRNQVRSSLAEETKWQNKEKQIPFSDLNLSTPVAQTFTGVTHIIPSISHTPKPSHQYDSTSLDEPSNHNIDNDRSIFENESFDVLDIDNIVSATKADFLRCVQFLLAVLIKLLARGFEPHLYSLITSLNWNQFYYTGIEQGYS